MVGVGLQIDWVVADGFCGRLLGQESWMVALAIHMGCWVLRHSSHGFWVFGTIIVVAGYWWGCWVVGLMGHKWLH